jgi:hypothetical protein
MGNFYVNHTVRAPQDRVVAALRAAGRTAFVGPTTNGYTVVCDHDSDSQHEGAITALGRELSAELRCPLVAFLNHDDDILCYWVYDKGRLVEEYNSCPSYFDDDDEDDGADVPADGEELCRLFGRPAARERVRAILADPGEMFVSMAHHELAATLGLPACVAGAGYRYVAEGDADLTADECVHVGRRAAVRHHPGDDADDEDEE